MQFQVDQRRIQVLGQAPAEPVQRHAHAGNSVVAGCFLRSNGAQRDGRMSLEVKTAIHHDGESLLDDVREDLLRRVRHQLQLGGLVLKERLLKSLRNDEERRGVATIHAAPAFLAARGFEHQHLGKRLPAECAFLRLGGECPVFVGHQKSSLRRGLAASKDQSDKSHDDQRNSERYRQRQGIAPQPAEVLLYGGQQKRHFYSRSSLPVSLMKRLSRLGCVSVVPRTSAPTPASAAKIAGSFCDAPASDSNSRLSSTCRISASICCIAARADCGAKTPVNRNKSRSPSIDRSSARVPAAITFPWSMIAR